MRCRKPTETQAEVVKGILKGAVRGAAVGSAGAIVSGAAVILTTPVWVPWIGGTILISGSTLATWTAAGAVTGAVAGGTWGYLRAKQRDRLFRETFGLPKAC